MEGWGGIMRCSVSRDGEVGGVTLAFSCACPEVIAVVSEERPQLIGKIQRGSVWCVD